MTPPRLPLWNGLPLLLARPGLYLLLAVIAPAGLAALAAALVGPWWLAAAVFVAAIPAAWAAQYFLLL